jgi:hypothetical protein
MGVSSVGYIKRCVMRCKKVEWLLSDYIDGTLDAPTRAILEEHLHSCQACKSSLRRLERTVRLVKDAPMPQPPEYYWSDFTPHLMERLRREEEAGKAWKAWLSELFWTRRPAIVVTSAAAMAVVLSVFLMHERSKRPEESGRAGAVSILDVPYVTMPHSSIRTVDAADTRRMGMPGRGIAQLQMVGDIHPLVIESVEQARGWLGIGVQNLTPALQTEFGVKDGRGVVVAMVVESGPAQRAGLKEGDVIRSFNGKALGSSRDLFALVAQSDIGKKVALSIVRDGKEKTIDVTIGACTARGRECDAGLGLVLKEITPQLALRFNMGLPPRGLLVAGVRPGSAASRAGLRRSDIILDVNRSPVAGLAAWEELVKDVKPGQKFLVRTRRGFFVIKAD